MNRTNEKPRLRGMHHTELEELLASGGFEKFRAKQLYHWLQKKMARSFDEMTNLPAPLRSWLAANTELGGIAEVLAVRESADGSFKFLFGLADGRKVESVLMPDPKRNYWTQCISSQVGCAVDCKFCVTGMNGFFRNMTPAEIIDQVLFARRYLLERKPEAIYRNLVFMGMGEPLLNTDAVIRTIRILTSHAGVDLSPRRITVSTSGIIPGMIELAESGVDANLALSLNAVTQSDRERIMPITKKYPLDEVLDVVRKYKFGKNKRVTFEYVMLHGDNDQPEHARQMIRLLRGLPCKINLIPFNPHPQIAFERPEREHVDQFARLLIDAGFTVSVRWSKALDVEGACGQLAGEHRQRAGRKLAGVAAPSMPPDLDFFATVADEEAAEDDPAT